MAIVSPQMNVLDPDHPLLEKFQGVLKQHLLTQIARLKEEVLEIEANVEAKSKDVKQTGVRTYEYQQKVYMQQKDLENLVSNIGTASAINEAEQHSLEKNKKELKNIENRLYQTEKCNRDLQKEIEGMTTLNKQLSQSENKIESHISVNKRKAQKSRADNNKLAHDKKKQDFLIHTLNEEVWRLESELENLSFQLKNKEKEIEDLEENVAIGNTSISALQSEYKALMHSWNSVVVAIASRDKGLQCLQQDLYRLQEKYKSLVTETEQVRKLTKRELVQNETFTYVERRIRDQIKNCKTEIESNIEKKTDLENKILEFQAILEKTEHDTNAVVEEIMLKRIAIDQLIKSHNVALNKKLHMEEEILSKLQGELLQNKQARIIERDLNAIRSKRQQVAAIAGEVENRNHFLKAEAESQRARNEELRQIDKGFKEQHDILEKEYKKMVADREKCDFQYRKKENQIEVLNSKLKMMTDKRNGEHLTKTELRLIELEKMIEEAQHSVKKLQIVWLREQNNIITISKERQEQIHNINLLKKQVLILEQKNTRICDDIEDIRKREEKVKQNINNVSSRTMILCNKVFQKKNKKVELDRSTALLQSTYETKLKESELELLQIEYEIADIEESKTVLSKELIDVNREVLEWEKNFLSTKDRLMDMKGARGKGGELNSMRLEIHKMHVIYSQLKRAQEKLLKDMEYGIQRRDKIYYTSEALQIKTCTKDNKAEDRIRMNLTKKLGNLKNQIKQTNNDITALRKRVKLEEIKKMETERKISNVVARKGTVYDQIDQLKDELEDTKVNREFKFQLLVINQRRALMYKQVIRHETPYTIYKKKQELVEEYAKAKCINGKLVKITGALQNDFPGKKNIFIKIQNTLGLVTLCMYV